MNPAAKAILQFALVGLITAGAVVAVTEVARPFPKTGTLTLYFAYAAAAPQIVVQGNQYTVTQVQPTTEGPPERPTILSLEVTIDSIRVHSGDSDDESAWPEISSATVTLNLMKQSGETILLGTMTNVAEQNITMVRLQVVSGSASIQDMPDSQVKVPSDVLKIPVSAPIRGQLATSITIFPGSVRVTTLPNGDIILRPVLLVKQVDGPK